MIAWLFGDLFYWIALIALIGGAILYVLSYFVGFIPMLKAHAMILKIVGLVLVILGGYYVANQNGYQRRVAEDQAEIDRLNAEARAKEAELNKKLVGVNSALRKAKDDVKAKQDNLTALVDSNKLRLPSSCAVQTPTDATAGGGDKTPPSESERQVIKDIVTIAADGDAAIVSLNACINQYNEVMKTVNEGVK